MESWVGWLVGWLVVVVGGGVVGGVGGGGGFRGAYCYCTVADVTVVAVAAFFVVTTLSGLRKSRDGT